MNPAQLSIRRMKPQDLDSVIALASDLPTAPHWSRLAYAAALKLPHISLIAEKSGLPVGFAVANLVVPQAELEIIAVAAHEQRRGTGRQLFAALVRLLKQAEVTEVILEVRASNLPALALYRSLNFRENGRRPRYYVDPVEDAILMELLLA